MGSEHIMFEVVTKSESESESRFRESMLKE